MGRTRARTRSKRGKEIHTKKASRKKVILAWVVIILMIASVFGIMLSGFGPTFDSQIEISEYTFGQGEDGWQIISTPRGKSEFRGELFMTLPYTYAQYADVAQALLQSGMPYLSLNLSLVDESLDILQAQDFARSLLAQTLFELDVFAIGAMAEENLDFDFPVVECTDADYFVVEFVQSTEEGIFFEDTCVRIQGNTQMSILQFTDALRFALIQ